MNCAKAALARGLLAATLGGLILAAASAPGRAQTTPAQCAADSLVLLSPAPESVQVRLSRPDQRFGTLLQWAPLDPGAATCAVPVGVSALPFSVSLTGVYRDRVDRLFNFAVLAGGEVGSQTQNRVVLSWANAFLQQSGAVLGEINLSNTGGLWRFDTGTGAWSQSNLGLPMTLPYTRIQAFAQSPAAPEQRLLFLAGRGLWRQSGALPWQRIAADVFTNSSTITTLSYAPGNPDWFAVGTTTRGLLITRDGGQTFTQFGANLDPAPPPAINVTAATWLPDGRLLMAVRGLGVFRSTDNGLSWVKLANLLVPIEFTNPGSTLIPPQVNGIVADPQMPARIYFTLVDYAVYRSDDGGGSWAAATGAWVNPATAPATGTHLLRDPADAQTLLVGTEGRGIWRTTDGGATWNEVGGAALPEGTVKPAIRGLAAVPGGATLYAAADNHRILVSNDRGASWEHLAAQPSNRLVAALALDQAGGGVYAATYDGGIYIPGTPIALSETTLPVTEPRYRDFDFGLYLAFGAGMAPLNATFQVKCQDFQGYAVWRSELGDPFNMQLIGMYDKTNPATCIQGFCGDRNFTIIPGCFFERRAACFDISRQDTIFFFDDNVFNGFTYNYAVTAFDYGSTAGVEPASLTRDLLFSPRFDDDPYSPFTTPGNVVQFQVNVVAPPAPDGPEIYCYPNPLRRGAGFSGGEGEQVVFTNLPQNSRVRVYTEDGDLVGDLGREQQIGANIYWDTRNPHGALLASGIYFWKVEMPERGDYFGKLVIIR